MKNWKNLEMTEIRATEAKAVAGGGRLCGDFWKVVGKPKRAFSKIQSPASENDRERFCLLWRFAKPQPR